MKEYDFIEPNALKDFLDRLNLPSKKILSILTSCTNIQHCQENEWYIYEDVVFQLSGNLIIGVKSCSPTIFYFTIYDNVEDIAKKVNGQLNSESNIIFEPLFGKIIEKYVVEKTYSIYGLPDDGYPHIPNSQKEYIDKIRFFFTDGDTLSVGFDIDFTKLILTTSRTKEGYSKYSNTIGQNRKAPY